MNWRLFLGWRELKRHLVCRTIGHRIVFFRSETPDLDAKQWSGRCLRCDRVFPRVLMVTYMMLSREPDDMYVAHQLRLIAHSLRYAPDARPEEYERMFR